MRILYISYSGRCDDEMSFYKEYVKQGAEVFVIAPAEIKVNKTYSPSGKISFDKNYDGQGYTFFPVKLVLPGLINGFSFLKFYQAVKKIEPDVIHVFADFPSTHLFEALLCRNILYGKRVPVITRVVQNIPFKDYPWFVSFSLAGILKPIFHKIIRPFLFWYNRKYVNGITGISSESIKILKDIGIKVPTETIFNGINSQGFYPKNKYECRKKMGFSENIKLAGFFGRIIKEKGLDNLVEAISMNENWHLLIIGSGYENDNYENELKQKIESLGIKNKVYFLGPVEHQKLVDYYNCLDVFILASLTRPNWKEQYGIVLAEAILCNVLIIGSSSGAIPEVIKGYPLGVVFKEGDTKDLAEKIKIIENLKIPLNFDMKNFTYKYTAENFAKEHINFYQKLINASKN
jgi:glycosyltransferase involved in cell wall biosynthesis